MDKQLAGSTKKFLFDLNDFDEEAIRRAEAAARRPTFSQDEMEASRQTGYEEGRIEGLKEAIGSQEAQIRDLMQQIVITADRMAQDESDRMATFIDQAALIAVQALSKTLPVLLDQLAAHQIAHFITEVLEEQVKGQSLVIYVGPTHEANVRERLSGHAVAIKRAETWVIKTDPALSDLQCRIEWTGGGADWDPGHVSARLLDTIVNHLPETLRPQAVVQEAVQEAAPSEVAETGETTAISAPAMDEADRTAHTGGQENDNPEPDAPTIDATTSGDES